MQLFRLPVNATSSSPTRPGTKILSVWPKKARLTLYRSWKYARHVQQLTPGRYVWFVWPGVGPKAANRYGALLGQSQFVYKNKS